MYSWPHYQQPTFDQPTGRPVSSDLVYLVLFIGWALGPLEWPEMSWMHPVKQWNKRNGDSILMKRMGSLLMMNCILLLMVSPPKNLQNIWFSPKQEIYKTLQHGIEVHLIGVIFLTDYADKTGLLVLCATFGCGISRWQGRSNSWIDVLIYLHSQTSSWDTLKFICFMLKLIHFLLGWIHNLCGTPWVKIQDQNRKSGRKWGEWKRCKLMRLDPNPPNFWCIKGRFASFPDQSKVGQVGF